MSIFYPSGGGNDVDLDVITAGEDDILTSKVIVDKDGNPLTGTMPDNGAVNKSLAINSSYTIPKGYHNGSGRVTQSIPTLGAKTYTPSKNNQTIASGRYLSGTQTIKGDANLIAANIKKNVTIFGIKGTWEGYVAGPTDLYYRGNNPANFKAVKNAKLDSGQITATGGQTTTISAPSVNLTGKTKCKIEYADLFYLGDWLDVGLSIAGTYKEVRWDDSEPDSGTISIDISTLQMAGELTLKFSAGASSYVGNIYDLIIFRIWLE